VHRRVRRGVQLLGVVGFVLLLGGCDWVMPDSISEQGQHAQDLWKGVIIAGLAVAVFMYVLILTAVFRGRSNRRRDADAIPGQRQDNIRLELVYFGVPVLICIVLFGFSASVQGEITDVSDDPDLVVEVVGYQWGWQFRYEDQDVVVTSGAGQQDWPVLVLPTDRTVRFELVADDVIHSFWIPDVVTKRDLIPGIDNEIDLDLTEVGTYPGRCAEFCGLEHWAMQFSLQTMAPDDFDAWLADAQQADQPIVGRLDP
jgi:cytochrome c oxidase subunit 2